MPLAPGTRLGPYEIVAPLGAGGMGEVYRARDPRLGREVAIKVLPSHLSASPEVKARFEREARTVSQLNHPNICTLFDVGRAPVAIGPDEIDYLVMELVDGETLAQRLARGPLPLDQVLRLGVQVADALDRAHKAGVVHRDLKPGNVMVTAAGAKLMDFGLARVTGMSGPAGSMTMATLSQSPTRATPLTAEGTLVGTFQYMAPEQLEGRESDARADLWALGCVLYEMATGRRAFDGRSQASLIGAIMHGEPAPLSSLVSVMPAGLEHVVRRCLAKDPDQRWQSAADIRHELDWVSGTGASAVATAPALARRRARPWLSWALAAALVAALAALAVVATRPVPRPAPVLFTVQPPRAVTSLDLPRISPDGRRLAYNATDSAGVASIWVRPMDALEARRLQGTEGATRPFWSPDGRELAFFARGRLMRVGIEGGEPRVICEWPRGADGSWGAKGTVVFDGRTGDSLMMVPADGGVPVPAVTLDRAGGESFAAWPEFLPDGERFLYVGYEGTIGKHLRVGSIRSPGRPGKRVGEARSKIEYAAGYVLQLRGSTLMAQRFDPRALVMRGDPAPLVEGVDLGGSGNARFSSSDEGVLVYRAGEALPRTRLVWVDRAGRTLSELGEPGVYSSPVFSRDESQLLLLHTATNDPEARSEIWTWDLRRDVASRWSFDSLEVADPVWTPDESGVVFSRRRGSDWEIVRRPLSGRAPDSVLVGGEGTRFLYEYSPDGAALLYIEEKSGKRWDVKQLRAGVPAPEPLLDGPYLELGPRVSPDGRWLAYQSFESGAHEVFVQAYPGPGPKWRISPRGGVEPMWRSDGRELFYLSPERTLMSVAVEPGAVPRFGQPARLFDSGVMLETDVRNRYLVSRDGKRFLLVRQIETPDLASTTVLLHWPSRFASR